MKDLRPIVAEHPFFKGMAPQYLDVLARHASKAEFKPGQLILHQNQAAYEFFLIMDGKVAVESHVPRADDLPLQVVGEGDVLGWSWLFPPFHWCFQARALNLTSALVLDGARLLVTCENDHDLGYELMSRVAQLVVHRLQSVRKRLVQLYQPNGSPTPIQDPAVVQPSLPVREGKPLRTLLSEHPFLKGISSQHLKILADAAMQTQWTAEQLIFSEGDHANRFYLIQHGKVLLQIPGVNNIDVPIQTIGDGDVLGWSWLFPPFYWHFEARALEPTTALFLYGTRLREECEADHDLGYDLMKRVVQVLIQRLQATRHQWLEIHASQRSIGVESRSG